MERRFGRVATPAIVIGRRVFWGFFENRSDIADLLGIDEPRAPERRAPEPSGAEPEEAERVRHEGEGEGASDRGGRA